MNALLQAAPLVGVPYRLHGTTPDGWDCLGCARYVRETLFGRPWRSDGVEYTDLEGLVAKARAERIAERIGEWRLVGNDIASVLPGSVLLFQVFGSPSHVAVALTGRDFIHCIGGVGTAIVDLDREPQWERRLRGVYD